LANSSLLLKDIDRKLFAEVLSVARATFGVGNRFGVHAYGIGPRICRGHVHALTTLNVYVLRKLKDPKFQVPTLSISARGRTWQLKPNVIATGARPQAAIGGAPAFSGMHPGAPIVLRGRTRGRGAIAAILGQNARPTHALTAGHLFQRGALGEAVFAAESARSVVRQVGELAANFLDSHGVDAALIQLNSTGQGWVNDQGPPLADFVSELSCFKKLARSFLATANDYSREVHTGPKPIDVHLTAPTRGVFLVKDVVTTDGEITRHGDSGTVLCAGRKNALAMGICSGGTGHHSVFEPMERVINLVQGLNKHLSIV
jgi:hypothetical protein